MPVWGGAAAKGYPKYNPVSVANYTLLQGLFSDRTRKMKGSCFGSYPDIQGSYPEALAESPRPTTSIFAHAIAERPWLELLFSCIGLLHVRGFCTYVEIQYLQLALTEDLCVAVMPKERPFAHPSAGPELFFS